MAAPIPRELLRAFTSEQQRLLEPIAEIVEQVTGQSAFLPPLAELPPGAALGDVIQKVNALLRRLQGVE